MTGKVKLEGLSITGSSLDELQLTLFTVQYRILDKTLEEYEYKFVNPNRLFLATLNGQTTCYPTIPDSKKDQLLHEISGTITPDYDQFYCNNGNGISDVVVSVVEGEGCDINYPLVFKRKTALGNGIYNVEISGNISNGKALKKCGYSILPSFDVQYPQCITLADARAIQQHVLGKDKFTYRWQYIAGDVTGNKRINAQDAVAVIIYLVQGTPLPNFWRIVPKSYYDSYPFIVYTDDIIKNLPDDCIEISALNQDELTNDFKAIQMGNVDIACGILCNNFGPKDKKSKNRGEESKVPLYVYEEHRTNGRVLYSYYLSKEDMNDALVLGLDIELNKDIETDDVLLTSNRQASLNFEYSREPHHIAIGSILNDSLWYRNQPLFNIFSLELPDMGLSHNDCIALVDNLVENTLYYSGGIDKRIRIELMENPELVLDDLVVAPIPCTGEDASYIYFHLRDRSVVKVSLYSSDGQQISSSMKEVPRGNNVLKVPSFANQKKGLYFVTIEYNNKMVTRRLIKM